MLNLNDVGETFDVKVLVQFAQKGGTVKQGDFMATFRREDPDRVQVAIEDGLSNIDLLFNGWIDKDGVTEIPGVLVAAGDIGRSPSDLLAADESLAFVKKSAECVNAAAVAFIKATRAERYIEGTSKKRSSRG